MTRTTTLALAGLLAIGLLGATSNAVAIQDYGNLWFPDDNGTLVSVALQNACGQDSIVPIPDGGAQAWVADHPAAVDVDFGADPFFYYLVLADPFVGTAMLYVGSGTPPSTFTPFGSAALVGDGDTVLSGHFTITGPQVVPAGSRLAFIVENTGDEEGGSARRMEVVTGCEQGSYFASGPSDPGYPTPEFATLALVGAGVVGVGALALRRK